MDIFCSRIHLVAGYILWYILWWIPFLAGYLLWWIHYVRICFVRCPFPVADTNTNTNFLAQALILFSASRMIYGKICILDNLWIYHHGLQMKCLNIVGSEIKWEPHNYHADREISLWNMLQMFGLECWYTNGKVVLLGVNI